MPSLATHKHRLLTVALASFAAALLAPGCSGEHAGVAQQSLTAACVDSGAAAPAGAWICGETETVECTTHEGAFVDDIYVELPAGKTCATEALTVSNTGPFPSSTYTIDVTDSVDGGPPELMCSSTLVVVDTVAPAHEAHEIQLWPPDHAYRHIAPSDCVTITDACDPAPKLWFTGASSDEPDDALGDGATAGDIANLGCAGVDLRAERQGTGDGRVYTLFWHAEDHAGNKVDGTCRAVVPHDHRGEDAVDSGEDHHVELSPYACR